MILREGEVLLGRYRVGRPLGQGVYEVQDVRVADLTLVVREVPLPDERLRCRVEEQWRACSWLTHPRIEAPRHLFATSTAAYTVVKPLEGRRLAEVSGYGMPEVLQWAVELCDLLDHLHQRLDLGPVTGSHMLVDGAGHLCLVGLRLDPEFRLALEPGPDAGLWTPPEGGRSDVWTVGVLLRRLLTPALLASVDRTLASQVSRLTMRATAPDRGARPAALSILKVQLEEALWAARPAAAAPPPVLEPSMRVRPGFGGSLATVAAAAVLLAGCLWGGLQVGQVVAVRLPALRAVPMARGGDGWVHGTVASAGPRVESPLTGAPSVAYNARLTRVVVRDVWDGAAMEYVRRRDVQVVVDRAEAVPFLLDGVPVEAARPVLDGPAVRPGDLEEGTRAGRTAALARTVRVEVGERVDDLEGVERTAVPGQTVLARGRLGGDGVFRLAEDGRLNLFLGSRSDLAVAGLLAALPGLLALLLGAAGLLALAERRRSRRAGPRRQALERQLEARPVSTAPPARPVSTAPPARCSDGHIPFKLPGRQRA